MMLENSNIGWKMEENDMWKVWSYILDKEYKIRIIQWKKTINEKYLNKFFFEILKFSNSFFDYVAIYTSVSCQDKNKNIFTELRNCKEAALDWIEKDKTQDKDYNIKWTKIKDQGIISKELYNKVKTFYILSSLNKVIENAIIKQKTLEQTEFRKGQICGMQWAQDNIKDALEDLL